MFRLVNKKQYKLKLKRFAHLDLFIKQKTQSIFFPIQNFLDFSSYTECNQWVWAVGRDKNAFLQFSERKKKSAIFLFVGNAIFFLNFF